MSTSEFDHQCSNVAGDIHVEPLHKNCEIGDSNCDAEYQQSEHQTQEDYDDQQEIAPEPTLHTEYEHEQEPALEPNHQIVQEDDIRSRHTSTSSDTTEPIQEEPVVELKKEVFKREVIDENENNEHNEENRENNGGSPKQVRPLQKPEFTQSTVVKKEIDENDWAVKNSGSGKIKGLISLFNSGAVLESDNKANGAPGTYKTDYGVGQGKKITQSTFR